MIFADLASRAHTARRSSGTATRPTFGSRVENAYFVVSAACVAVSALNSADFPTLGRPTIPQLKPISFPHQTVMTGRGPVIQERNYSRRSGTSPNQRNFALIQFAQAWCLVRPCSAIVVWRAT